MFVLSIPCVLGFNVLKNIRPLGFDIMNFEDFLVSNLFLPLGSLVFILFSVTKKGWGWNNFVTEANAGKGLKLQKFMRGYMTFVLPVMVFVIFIVGIYNFIIGWK